MSAHNTATTDDEDNVNGFCTACLEEEEFKVPGSKEEEEGGEEEEEETDLEAEERMKIEQQLAAMKRESAELTIRCNRLLPSCRAQSR